MFAIFPLLTVQDPRVVTGRAVHGLSLVISQTVNTRYHGSDNIMIDRNGSNNWQNIY